MRMRRMMVVFAIAWVPLLSGCMMMGMGMHAMNGAHGSTDHHADGVIRARAQAGGLELELSFRRPNVGVTLPIAAVLRPSQGGANADTAVRLRVRRPDGVTDEFAMERASGSEAGEYVREYRFDIVGTYLLSASAGLGPDGDAPALSVRTEISVGVHDHDGHHDWAVPAAIAGGVGMLLMGLMMGPWS